MKARPRLLLVYDDLGAMRYVVMALQKAGYDVTLMWSVAEAIAFLKAYSQTVDGVILDVILRIGEVSPEDNDAEQLCGGNAVCGYLQTTHPGIPILVLSNVSSGRLLEQFAASDHVRVARRVDHTPSEIAAIVTSLVGSHRLDDDGENPQH